ncbi:MAG: mandelate racemase/muconate lactonizing enzyme family protein [Chloroflexota bacterium]
MKIVDVRIRAVRPFGDREATAGSVVGWVFVEIEVDDGLIGIGECSNWPRHGNAIVAQALAVIRRDLIGRDPRQIGGIWHALFRQFTYLGSRGLGTTVMSGIDIALWDLRGKALGEPIHRLLEGAVRDAIPLYGHADHGVLLFDDSPDELVARVRALAADGYAALKLDPFVEAWPSHTAYLSGTISRAGIRQGAALVGAMRDAVGPDFEILIDAHGSYNVASAIACMDALAPYGITWFEEPVPPESLAALRQVSARASVPICVGERLYTRWDVLPILSEGLASFLMPDVCWTGGISELKRIATLAESFGVTLSPHNALGPIQIMAGAHVMMTVPNFYRLEIHTGWLAEYDGCLTRPLDIREGSLFVSDRPGLGVELDEAFLREHAVPLLDEP